MKMPLHTSADATLDGSGLARVALGPVSPGAVWNIRSMTTNGNGAIEPTLKIYRGIVSDSTMLDTTQRGNADVSDTELSLQTGETVIAEWTGGTPGAQYVLRVEGEITDRWEGR